METGRWWAWCEMCVTWRWRRIRAPKCTCRSGNARTGVRSIWWYDPDRVNGDGQVVGVVRDVRHVALEENSGSEMYMPIRQCQDWGSVDLVVRSTLPLPVLSERVEAALRPLIPSLPKGSMRPLTRLVDHAISPRRFIVLLLTGFATFALVLVSLGIYGVVSY